MRKTTFSIALALTSFISAYSQNIELEYVHDVAYVKDDKALLLKKQPVQLKVKSSAKNFIPVVGLVAGSSKSLYYLAGTESDFKIDSSNSYTFIIKENSNSTNPVDIIQVGKFHVTSKNREFTFQNTNMNVAEVKNSEGDALLEFESEKYGESSYKITLKNLPKGQYFISMSTVNDFYSFEIK